jgi:hypothetical protein
MIRTWVMILLAAVASSGCAQTSPGRRDTREATSSQPGAADPKSGTIAMGCGYLVVENHGEVHFTAFVTGNDMQQVRRGMPIFVMDDVLLEIETATAATIGTSDRGADLLRSHLRWEADFISRTNQWPALSPVVEPVQSGVSGVEALRWTYEAAVPGVVHNRRVTRVMYVTAAIDGVVLAISAPMRSEDDPRAVAAKLDGIVRTVRRSPGPLDVGDLAKQFDEAHDRAKTCAQWGGA